LKVTTVELLAPLLEDFFSLDIEINDEQTRYLYRLALKNFGEAIGRPPNLTDLTNDNLARMTRTLLNRRLAVATVNERCRRVAKFWEFLARRGSIQVWPIRIKLPEPARTPVAWLRPELARIFGAVKSLQGEICGVPRAKWWRALLLVDWDTGERIGALLALKWSYIAADGWMHVPAEVRKGKRKDMTYRLAPDTLDALNAIRLPLRELLFPWPHDENYIFNRFEKILERAGLPTDRKSKFHRIRRSVASHYEGAGGNATRLLGHEDRRTTIRSYLDPRIVEQGQAIDLLFRPEADAG
jgi:integrase